MKIIKITIHSSDSSFFSMDLILDLYHDISCQWSQIIIQGQGRDLVKQ